MREKIKCVVWDLDNTVWDGVFSEDKDVMLNPEAYNAIIELDKRGILQSIASKNEFEPTALKLKELGIFEYFLYPQITWNSKAESLRRIQKELNFGINTFAFVDDQQFERDEVQYSLPEVLCIDAKEIPTLLELEVMHPNFITVDSKVRRKLYQADITRNKEEEKYKGPKEDFLKTLGFKFTIEKATEEDLQRIEELTVRTHQLNSTGTIYSYDELINMINFEKYGVYIAQLDDKYGTYGKIGIAVVEKSQVWEIKLILMSCRVISKGVGSVLLSFLIQQAKKNNVDLLADFIPTDKNRIMYITYKFSGFEEISNDNNLVKLKAKIGSNVQYPQYVEVIEKL
nr:HAD-IIIC family phosphatase [uncultured Blautia sp.]